MKKNLEKYSGVILLYSVVIIGVIVLNARYKYLNEIEIEGAVEYAVIVEN
jgi:hypothetical protein